MPIKKFPAGKETGKKKKKKNPELCGLFYSRLIDGIILSSNRTVIVHKQFKKTKQSKKKKPKKAKAIKHMVNDS